MTHNRNIHREGKKKDNRKCMEQSDLQTLLDTFCSEVESYVDKPEQITVPLWKYAFDNLSIWHSDNQKKKEKQWKTDTGELPYVNTLHNINVLCTLLKNQLEGVFNNLIDIHKSLNNNNNEKSDHRETRTKKTQKIIEKNRNLIELLPESILQKLVKLMWEINPYSLLTLAQTSKSMRSKLISSEQMKLFKSMIFITNLSSKMEGLYSRQYLILCLHSNQLYQEEIETYTFYLDSRDFTISYGLYAACHPSVVKQMAHALETPTKEILENISKVVFYLITGGYGRNDFIDSLSEGKVKNEETLPILEFSQVKQYEVVKKLYHTVTEIIIPLLNEIGATWEIITGKLYDLMAGSPDGIMRQITSKSRSDTSKTQFLVAVKVSDASLRLKMLLRLFDTNKKPLIAIPFNVIAVNEINRFSLKYLAVLFGDRIGIKELEKYDVSGAEFKEKYGELLPTIPFYNAYFLTKVPLERPLDALGDPKLTLAPLSYTIAVMNAISFERLYKMVEFKKDSLWVRKLWQSSEIGPIEKDTAFYMNNLKFKIELDGSHKGFLPMAKECSPQEIMIESIPSEGHEESEKKFGVYPSLIAVLSLVSSSNNPMSNNRYAQLAALIKKLKTSEKTCQNQTSILITNLLIQFIMYVPVYFGKIGSNEPDVVFYGGYVGLKSQPNTPVSIAVKELLGGLKEEPNMHSKLGELDEEQTEIFSDMIKKFDGFVDACNGRDYNMYYVTTLISALCGFDNANYVFYFHGRVQKLRLDNTDPITWNGYYIRSMKELPDNCLNCIIQKKNTENGIEIRNYTTFNYGHMSNALMNAGIVVKNPEPESISSYMISSVYKDILVPLVTPARLTAMGPERLQSRQNTNFFMREVVMKGSVVKRYSNEQIEQMSDESNESYVKSLAEKKIINLYPRRTIDQSVLEVCGELRKKTQNTLIKKPALIMIIGELINVLPTAVVEDYYNYLVIKDQ